MLSKEVDRSWKEIKSMIFGLPVENWYVPLLCNRSKLARWNPCWLSEGNWVGRPYRYVSLFGQIPGTLTHFIHSFVYSGIISVRFSVYNLFGGSMNEYTIGPIRLNSPLLIPNSAPVLVFSCCGSASCCGWNTCPTPSSIHFTNLITLGQPGALAL